MKMALRGLIRSIRYSGNESPLFYRGLENEMLKFDVEKGQLLIGLDDTSAVRIVDDLITFLKRKT